MISVITNEEELENVVGGIKARHVVGTIVGIVGLAALIVGGKFVYDVYDEYGNRKGQNGGKKVLSTFLTDASDAVGWETKSPYRQLVTKATNFVFEFRNKHNI